MTTASEDIRDVLQVLQLVSARPCIVNKASAKSRGTAIAYAELTRITKRLTEALAKLEPETPPSAPNILADATRCKSGHLVVAGFCQAQRGNCVCNCAECEASRNHGRVK